MIEYLTQTLDLISTLQRIGFRVLFIYICNSDSLDWQERGTEDIINQVTKKVKPGSIVLFHNNSRDILEALPSILDYCKKESFEVVPISELIYKDGFTIDNNGMQVKQ